MDAPPAPLPDLPAKVSRQAVNDALNALGIEHRGLMSVYFAPRAVTLVYKRLDSEGNGLIAGGELATVTATVNIEP